MFMAARIGFCIVLSIVQSSPVGIMNSHKVGGTDDARETEWMVGWMDGSVNCCRGCRPPPPREL